MTAGPEPIRGLRGPAMIMPRGDDRPMEPIQWIWLGWLARGRVHLLAGPPGVGKTTLALALAATVTQGGTWPDGAPCAAGEVAIWSGEDDYWSVLVPRLAAMGADLSRVHLIEGVAEGGPGPARRREWNPAIDLPLLDRHLASHPVRPSLLILDPIALAVMGDSHRNAEVRRSLDPLVRLVAEHGVALLGLTHYSKGRLGVDPIERVTGSIAFAALARIVLAAQAVSVGDGAAPSRRIVRVKSNLGPDGDGYVYRVEPVELQDDIIATRVLWGEALSGSAAELLGSPSAGPPSETSAQGRAEAFLRDYLRQGPRAASDVERVAREEGHASVTLRRARKSLGIVARKDGYRDGWSWALPDGAGPAGDRPPESPVADEAFEQRVLYSGEF